MVGPYGDWVKYSLDESVELVTEIDGVSFHKCFWCQHPSSLRSAAWRKLHFCVSVVAQSAQKRALPAGEAAEPEQARAAAPRAGRPGRRVPHRLHRTRSRLRPPTFKPPPDLCSACSSLKPSSRAMRQGRQTSLKTMSGDG